ncbi:MAG TPA: replication initiation protein [Bryobacteraceae bacterium]|nr:replication initiation protein [Bryobacteraceae bacterium]
MNEESKAKIDDAVQPSPQQPAKVSSRARLVEKIRSELNIEKWPSIWQPAKSKNRPALRSMEREVTGEDGSRMVSRVEVGYTQLGTLTTEEQKLLYVLIQLWEAADKPDAQVFFSTRGLARSLRKKGWGTNVIQSITKSLRKLRTIPVEWINSYFDQTETGAVVVDRRPFSILGDLRIVERHQDGAVNSSLGYFKFDDHILSNLQLNFTKPVCIEEFFKLKSEIAQLIYSHIDLMLADKTKYERKSRELFDDLGLKNPEYNHMYERKRALEKAVKELQCIRLSTGTLRLATVEKTKDGKDYKACFQKTAPVDIAAERIEAAVLSDKVVINDYSKPKDLQTVQAEDLVKHFHQTFHGVSAHAPQSKETGQAFDLVSRYGLEKSKRIVDFAREQATSTNYRIQHFGAVLSYTSRALAEVERQDHQASAKPSRPSVVQPPRPQYGRGESRIVALSKEQYELRFENTKIILLRENLFLAQRQDRIGNSILWQMVRARMIRDLDQEPMELVPLDWMPEWLWHLAQNLPL